MNKTAIKNFAIWARRKLIDEIKYKAELIGINEKGVLPPLDMSNNNIQFFDIGTGKPSEISGQQIKQREELVSKIKEKEKTTDYKTAYQYIIEEVAYTWFNRIIAIRFMEINGYLPSGVRVLSSEEKGKSEPDIVTRPFDTDIKFSPYEKDRIIQLKHENKLDELFRTLFIRQCKELNEILPELFEKTHDYTELLFTISFTDKDGILSRLINDIPEEDFKEAVEIIGWMYQYYNTEPKDEVFKLMKKNVKITKERIPAATQLFTPDWIVRYMVENSLGRLWLEGHPKEDLKVNWKYFLEEAEQEENVEIELEKIREEYKKLNPEDIKIIDPAMGSGHILVYAFDVLMQIYKSQGYTNEDSVISIIKNNLYGLDIDDRAYQLAYFAIMMKARQYSQKFFAKGISPRVYSIKESNHIDLKSLDNFGKNLTEIEKIKAKEQIVYLINAFKDAKEYGSILRIENCDWGLLYQFIEDILEKGEVSLDFIESEKVKQQLKQLIEVGEVLSKKYDVVITNPPYMGSSGMGAGLSKYVKDNYPDSKSDLFAVFIEKCTELVDKNKFISMITQHAWMFLSSYEKLRSNILRNDIINMAHLGGRAFEEIGGEVVQTTAWVERYCNLSNYKAIFARLVDYNSQSYKEKAFLNRTDIHMSKKENFPKIPSSPVAYWVSENLADIFITSKLVGDIAQVKIGMGTGKNDLFVRNWWEIDVITFNFSLKSVQELDTCEGKWFPYNKGGNFRLWYGNLQEVLWYDENGRLKMKSISGHRENGGYDYYFRNGITWTFVSSSKFGVRCRPHGSLFDVAGSTIFIEDTYYDYMLAFLSSSVTNYILKLLNPTLNYQAGNIKSLPIVINYKEVVDQIARENVLISKIDWDSFETSWDFRRNPLLDFMGSKAIWGGSLEELNHSLLISDSYRMWKNFAEEQFLKLKRNEEELNRIFIDIYELQDELTPDVEEKDVTVTRIYDSKDEIPKSMKGNGYVLTKSDVVKSFISYSIGCMFGRYSLDIEGLAFAGGDWDESKYKTFFPDKNNCIPITDDYYFEDDIVGRFVEFVKVVYGEETLEENLDFIANALGSKGNSARKTIRNYFINSFYKDHVKTYKKRPIYWLYDSGKQNGFKALIYMHRYTPDTTGLVRVDYLHRIQKAYRSEIDHMNEIIENGSDTREIAQSEKKKERLIKQLKETSEYDDRIAHIALSRIPIDLDDGVKVNYEKVQTDKDGNIFNILGKI